MNNFCRNCGEKLDNGVMYCPKCGTQVQENMAVTSYDQGSEYKQKENKYIGIVAILYLLSIVCMFLPYLTGKFSFVFSLYPLFALASFVVLIYAKVKMRESKKIRVIFNIFCGLLAIGVILLIIVFAACTSTLESLEGCN